MFRTQAGGKYIFFSRQAVDLLPREVKVVFSGQEVNFLKRQYWSDFTQSGKPRDELSLILVSAQC